MKNEINIAQAVSELLYQLDRVVVPHFGTFTLTSHSATVDAERNLFKPPFKSLSFNSEEREDDGVLVSYLVKTYRLSSQEAVRTIKLFISSCVADMVLGKKVVFEGIGEFTIENQIIVFRADENANFDSASFGLTNFVMQPVSGTAEHGIGLRENRVRMRKMYVRRAIASAAAVLLLFAGFYAALTHDVQGRVANYASMLPFFYSSPSEYIVSNFDELFFEEELVNVLSENVSAEEPTIEEFENEVADETETIEEAAEVELTEAVEAVAELENTEEIQPIETEQVEEESVEQPAESVAEEQSWVVAEPVEEVVVEQIVEKQYYVIAGSFGSAENAARFMKTLEKKGFEPVTIEKNGKWRVAYAESTSKDDALQLLGKVRAEQDPNSWLIAK